MNSWENAHPGSWLTPLPWWALCDLSRTVHAARRRAKSCGRLVLRDVVGRSQVWIDGNLAGEKQDVDKKDMTIACPGGVGQRTVSVLIEAAAPDMAAGLGGIVTVE
jgi:beta-galactosidase